MNAASSVSVVDDDPLVLRAVGRLLQSVGLAVEMYSSAEEFLSRAGRGRPGCVVMDLSLPELNGLELQQALCNAADSRPVVFISGQGSVPASVEAMKAGAVDFLVKPLNEGKFLSAVRAALEKDRAARAREAGHASVLARLATLTMREGQVLRHVIAGKLNKQIAAELGTAEKTIKVHRARMMHKMAVGSVAELVRAWTLTQPLES